MNSSIRLHIEQKIGSTLDENTFKALHESIVPKTLKKKAFMIQEGDISKFITFIEKGTLHSYKTDESGNRHSLQFGLENHWIGDLSSFLTQQPAIFNIQALEDTHILCLYKNAFEELCLNHPLFERFFRILIQNAYVELQQRLVRNLSDNAEERYLNLIQKSPLLFQRIPNYLIASYLGIKPQSLSRIRKKLHQKK